MKYLVQSMSGYTQKIKSVILFKISFWIKIFQCNQSQNTTQLIQSSYFPSLKSTQYILASPNHNDLFYFGLVHLHVHEYCVDSMVPLWSERTTEVWVENQAHNTITINH